MQRLLFALLCLTSLIILRGPVEAGVIVVANRTDRVLDIGIVDSNVEQAGLRLLPGSSHPFSTEVAVKVRVTDDGAPILYEVQPYAIYVLQDGPAGLTLQEVGFSTPDTVQKESVADETPDASDERPAVAVIKVKVAIDDELLTRRDPEPRIRRRVAAASAFFESKAGIRFEIVDVTRWNTIDRISDFSALMVDFERKVPVEPDVLAIGFSTQASRSQQHMGGTRLPLHSHVLVRERGHRHLSEAGQLELLIHELGHYLGGVHSPERTSALRPQLGDGLADVQGFRIGLDPINTMIIALVGEEVRLGKIGGLWDLSPPTKQRLRRIYTDLAKALPDDPAAQLFLKALELTEPPPERPSFVTPLAESARLVVQAIVSAAEENIQRPDQHIAERFGKPYRLSGDELTEVYVRSAAQAAMEIPASMRPHAFAIGLAVAMDTSRLLRDQPLTRLLWRSIETERERHFRMAVLGAPTVRDQYEFVQHFSISAGLTALYGAQAAEAAGIWKEQTDATFSRGDYSADLAGITLFEWVNESPDRLEEIARDFKIVDYIPECRDFEARGAGARPKHLLDQKSALRSEILNEINRLRAYAAAAATD